MNIGLINHPVFGQMRVYPKDGQRVLQLRQNIQSLQVQKWLKIYNHYQILSRGNNNNNNNNNKSIQIRQTKSVSTNHKTSLIINNNKDNQQQQENISYEHQWKHCIFPKQVQEDPQVLSNKTLKLYFQNYFVSLKGETSNRIKMSMEFSKQEVYFILYSVVLGCLEWLDYVKKIKDQILLIVKDRTSIVQGRVSGSVIMMNSICSPKSSYSNNGFIKGFQNFKEFLEFKSISTQHVLLNQHGQVKLVTPISSPEGLPKLVYYPPELQPQTAKNNKGELSSNSIENNFNFSSSSIKRQSHIQTQMQKLFENYIKTSQQTLSFSIGMICVQIMILKTADSFYDYRNGGIIRYGDLKKWFAYCQKQYGQLWSLVNLMIQAQTKKRIKLGQIHALLKSYQENIIQTIQFTLQRQVCKQSLNDYLNLKVF